MIRQPVFFGIAILLLVVVAWFVVDRVTFLKTAERTTGTVTSVSGDNGRCGSRRNKYNCTRYSATVSYAVTGAGYKLNISAGTQRGHNQPLSYADPNKGARVAVVYDPKKPGKAYEDSIGGVWGTPLMVLMFQIGSLFTSFTEPKRRAFNN